MPQTRLQRPATGTETTSTGSETTELGTDNSALQIATYTVVSGDSLWKIAQRLLGNGNRYMEIYEANRDSLSSPGSIRVGQVLQIPGATPAVEETPTREEEVESAIEAGSEANEAVLSGQDPTSSVQETPPDNLTEFRAGSAGTEGITLAAGAWLTLTTDHMSGGAHQVWENVAKDHGMSEKHLVAFNQHVESVSVGGDQETGEVVTPDLAVGVRIYIPSAAEILLAQCRERTQSLNEATALYTELSGTHNLSMLTTARERASGTVGVGYGTSGDGGVFYSQNPELAGASSRRTSEINGQTEYRVNWGADFWKCSVFLNDVAFSSGYRPDMTDNNHYRLAGQLHQSNEWEEVSVKDARPGDGWQRFGGTRSNESHNAVLSSFVTVNPVSDTHEEWEFSIIGAESERAAESDRSHTMLKGTNENTQGKKIRFFRPKYSR